MSKGGKKANEFMRGKLGADVDAAAGAAGFRVIDKDGGNKDDEHGGKPWIELPGVGRQLSAFAHEAGMTLAEEPVFRRERYPVAVDPDTGMIEVITAEEFRSLIEQYAVTYKLKPMSPALKTALKAIGQEPPDDYENEPMTMTKDCASGTLKAQPFISALRRLDRVNLVRMPVMGADRVPRLLQEGYDEETRTWTLKTDIKINEKLTPESGQEIIRSYLAEFPFTDARSRAVAIAAMIALYVSQMQELTAARMGFVNRSNVEGAGKSLLAQCAISPCYGLAEGQPLAGREELRKLLDATALQGSPYLFLDNLTGHVASELLDSYLTTPIWTGRLLGTPKIFKAPANAMLLITGNGITLSPDIARRTLVCNLNVEEADPELRQPKRVMTPQFLARPEIRGDLLSAMWAMVRGWHAAGGKPGVRRVRSFEEWSDLVGGIVLANGFGDCLERPSDDETAEPKNVHKRLLVEKLANEIPEEKKAIEFTFEKIVDVCRENEFLDWMIDGKMVKEREKLDDGSYTETQHFECNRESRSKLARVFGMEMAGQHFVLKDGRRIQFGKRGKQRHRHYLVQIIEAPAK